jgi:hypothetical protein
MGTTPWSNINRRVAFSLAVRFGSPGLANLRRSRIHTNDFRTTEIVPHRGVDVTKPEMISFYGRTQIQRSQ